MRISDWSSDVCSSDLSKDPRDRPIADAAPEIDAYLTAEGGRFFEAVTRGLDAAGVRWTRASRLGRGLDYYRHTAFAFITARLGAQGTVLGGCRYDGLIETLDGQPRSEEHTSELQSLMRISYE